jgi:hypothetical protein
MAIAAIALLTAGGLVALGSWSGVGRGYDVDATSYGKSIFTPRESGAAFAVHATTPLPSERGVVAEEVEDDVERTESESERRESSRPTKPSRVEATSHSGEASATGGDDTEAGDDENPFGDLEIGDPFSGVH